MQLRRRRTDIAEPRDTLEDTECMKGWQRHRILP
jgi:hypothetical protein